VYRAAWLLVFGIHCFNTFTLSRTMVFADHPRQFLVGDCGYLQVS
jgi:hypothetical protein